jgi:uncharacterized damage-inducible protein DinB
MKRTDLSSSEFKVDYGNYIDMVDENHELVEALRKGEDQISDFFSKIDQNKLKTAYAEGKWTILEVLLHIIDTERIFNYRALCIARGDQTEFPGFEQDDYVAPSMANERSLTSLLTEYSTVRKATISLFENLREEDLKQLGRSSNSPLSPRAAGFIIAGHERHHEKIIKERYLNS